MAKKSKKQIKIEQANMQSDALDIGYSGRLDIEDTSDGIQYTGGGSGEYTFADLDDDWDMNTGTVSTGFTVDGLTFNNEEELRKKYPALQDAWDHYKNVKHMCEQKEKENED
jgi:hypothetical protein